MEYIVDTNVFMDVAGTLDVYGDRDLIVLPAVISELERYRKGEGEEAKNARRALREIRELVDAHKGSKRFELPRGGSLTLVMQEGRVADRPYADNDILDYLSGNNGVGLITSDNPLAIRAAMMDYDVESPEDTSSPEPDPHLILGLQSEIEFPFAYDGALWAGETVEIPDDELQRGGDLYTNQYFVLPNHRSLVVQYTFEDGKHMLRGVRNTEYIHGIKGETRDQQALFDACLGTSPFVAAIGRAGTGKSLVSLACALHERARKSDIDRVRIIRPFDDEFGYLPGRLEEKIAPAVGPMAEAGRFLFRRRNLGKGREVPTNEWDRLVKDGLVVLDIERFKEGETFRDECVIVDEAQNLTPAEVKMLATRLGTNSRMIFSGDPFQTKAATGMDERNNGLSHLVRRLKGKHLFTPVLLTERSVRSDAADLAGRYL